VARENALNIIFIILMSSDAGKKAVSAIEAFAAFYEQYLPKIFRYISYRINDKFLAEDITSTVFEKALTRFDQYNAEKAAMSTWIFRIARNTLIDHYRVNSRTHTVQLDEALDTPENDKSPEQAVIEEEESQMLKRCIAKLSPPEQEIVSLKFSAEMTNRQIAAMLGLSESNVGVIIYRAVRKLRNEFEGLSHG
jgi:RNA polymerase sigma factor (sigma-70 family)